MVRTYKQAGPYQLISPWEQAMRNADTTAGEPLHTGRRMYRDNSSFDASSSRQAKAHSLPPLSAKESSSHEKLLQIEVGKALNRSESKLDTVVKELVLYDANNTGTVTKIAALEILKRYRVPLDEENQKRFVEIFLSKHDPSRFEYHPAIAFMKRCAESPQSRVSQTQDVEDTQSARSRSQATPSKHETVQQQFSDRIDTGLLIQIENSFKNSAANPHELIDNLERTLESTWKREQNLVDKMHLKGQVVKHHFPFNDALTLKLIERLDPYEKGSVEWPKFVQFLRQAVHDHKRPSVNQARLTPAWENRAKLSDIRSQNGYRTDRVNDPDLYHDDDLLMFKFHDEAERSITNIDSAAYRLQMRRPVVGTPLTADGALANPQLYYQQTNSVGKGHERVDNFVQIADALKHKSKYTNDCLNILEVRKLVNYYNILLDLNIDIEHLESTLLQVAVDGEVNITQVIDALGRLV